MASDEGAAPTETSQPSIEDRAALYDQARAFLASPDVRLSDEASKREFLKSKGLNEDEVSRLIAEKYSASIPPSLPPRTYPQPIPSRLPDLLISMGKLFGWLMGISGTLTFVYYAFLLPRITKTLRAKHALKLEQSRHFSLLTDSITKLEHSQHALDYEVSLQTHKPISSLTEVPLAEDGRPLASYRVLIQSMISSSPEGRLTESAMIQSLAETFPYFQETQDEWQHEFRRHLSHTYFFLRSSPESDTNEYFYSCAPKPLNASSSEPLETSLSTLLTRLSSRRPTLMQPTSVNLTSSSPPSSAAQRTLKSLTDFTAYLSAQTCTLPSYPSLNTFPFNNNTQRTLGPAEDEVRKEIKALKGLVLNRRTFATMTPPLPLTQRNLETEGQGETKAERDQTETGIAGGSAAIPTSSV